MLLLFQGNHLSSRIHCWVTAAAKGLAPKNDQNFDHRKTKIVCFLREKYVV